MVKLGDDDDNDKILYRSERNRPPVVAAADGNEPPRRTVLIIIHIYIFNIIERIYVCKIDVHVLHAYVYVIVLTCLHDGDIMRTYRHVFSCTQVRFAAQPQCQYGR